VAAAHHPGDGLDARELSLAIAVQNLSWGILGIFVGMLADRIGAFKVLIGGSILYALGLVGMALSPSTVFLLTAGVLIGAAQAGTTYAVIYGVLGRQIPVARAAGPWAWPRRQARSASSSWCRWKAS
jgi:MFS family permease